ncbi:MAG: sigma 54-interacting transcriptional regulator [Deltaproteobacteria bacterium]|nr:sigma 54-interacting transcriptional regulator [Deltaproteobacteria bacterium]MBW1816758.1 sigma 54-interacting transcriptional regulator [Deltaproteobacteria bacterium]MBW2284359.1 sigma 54-interacting transcriptional regulator [Deltaproteobacteria bacterium]
MTQADETVILIVDDDEGHLTTLRTIIKSWGYRVDTANDGARAVEKVEKTLFDLILMDVRMAVMSGIEALKRIKTYNPAIPILIMTAYSSVESAVEALKTGAYDYLTKPLDFEALKLTIERALEHKMLKAENKALKEKIRSDFDLKSIIGKSRTMKALIDMVAMIAPSEATVLINGESGTGKELIARAIHFNSPRREGPLITVNCAALTETLLESELFGHEKGAFTGAEKRREGRFVQADNGTLFLDEIGEMSPAMQAKLLRVLQDGEVQRVGSDRTLRVDVRVLAATNRDLKAEMADGNFREDLYYRLNVVNLQVPPMRDRIDDIPLLAQHFLDIYAPKNRKEVKGFTPLAMDMLIKYKWPGNVRELENAVERAVIILAGDFITEKEMPLAIAQAYGLDGESSTHPRPVVGTQRLEDMEKMAVLAALEDTGGNKSEAARTLGITRRALYNKIEKFGL